MAKNRRAFSPEFNEEAVKMVSRSLGLWRMLLRGVEVHEQTLRNWVAELEKEVRELRLKSKFLGKAAAFFDQESPAT
jgi:transposase